jgi:uncharacterized membrane protein
VNADHAHDEVDHPAADAPDHGHDHHGRGHEDHTETDLQRASPALRRVLTLVVMVIGVVLALAVLRLFPYGYTPPAPDTSLASTQNVAATVTKVDSKDCGGSRCLSIAVRVEDGPEAGQTVSLPDMSTGPGMRSLAVFDEIVVSRVEIHQSGQTVYNYADRQRSEPLWVLGLAFAALVVIIARWRGAAALAGLGLTWVVLVTFLIPGILAGANAVAVAVTGASVVALIVLYVAHGVSARTTIALFGTLASLVLTGILAVVFVRLTQLTGLASEEIGFITAQGVEIDAHGLLLAGIILGTLGVLTDITVTQAAIIWEVHAADPTQTRRQLYAAGMRAGRDHIASTVDTLVLAYAGASLPLLVLFLIGSQQFGDVAASEIVAEEIVRTLLGSIGLVASVPITTGLAAFVVSTSSANAPRRPPPARTQRPGSSDPIDPPTVPSLTEGLG